MKTKLLIFLFCLCSSFTSFSQGMFSNTDSFKVVLQGSYSFTTGCGTMMIKNELKFKIINTDYSFIGIVTCAADQYGEFFFMDGDKFLIETTKLNAADSIYHSQLLKSSKKEAQIPAYSIVNVKKLK